MAHVSDILDSLGLTLAAAKTKLCIFSRDDKALRITLDRRSDRAYYR